VGEAQSVGNFFWSCPSTFLALKVQLVVLVSALVVVSTVWSVSCLLFFYSRCPRAQPFVKVGVRAPPPVPHGASATGCICQGRPSYGGNEPRCFIKFKGDKIRDKPINTRNLVNMSHFKAKIHQIRSTASIRPSLRLSSTRTPFSLLKSCRIA